MLDSCADLSKVQTESHVIAASQKPIVDVAFFFTLPVDSNKRALALTMKLEEYLF